jgi:hypothetical protein
MPIKRIVIKRVKKTRNGYPTFETQMQIIMEKQDQQPTQSEAMNMLAEGIIIVHEYSNLKKQDKA